MQAGTQVFLGVSVDGGDKTLVAKLQAIPSESGLNETAIISRQFAGASVSVSFGKVGGVATAAEITVGLKPVK
jgi:hypothetical protein